MLSVATKKLANIEMELIDTRRDLNCAERETAIIKIALSNTQVELNSTKKELMNSERTLARYQNHFVASITEVQSTIENYLADVKEDLVNNSSRISALEIVTHQIANLKNYLTVFSSKVTADANRLVYENALIKMYESGDQTCPVYIKINELIDNREIWCSKPFYLSKRWKVHLRIDASQYTFNQGPSLKLDIMDWANEELQGTLNLYLVSQHAEYNDFHILEKYCSITRWKRNVSTNDFPTQAFTSEKYKYVKDDSIIIIYVSFISNWRIFLYLLAMLLYLLVILLIRLIIHL